MTNGPAAPRHKSLSPAMVTMTAITLAGVALLLLLAAGIGTRMTIWSFRTGFMIMKYGAWFGLAAFASGCISLVEVFRHRAGKNVFASVAALIIGMSTFAIPYSWQRRAQEVPKIHDISTDTINPPRFVAILPLRANAPNPAEYGGAAIAAQQTRAYPELKTQHLDVTPERAFAQALDTAQRMKWHIVAAVPNEGRIEASDTTFWFGFTDDIAIRITPAGNGSQLDIRSVSRVGLSDVGTNARRIGQFLGKLPR